MPIPREIAAMILFKSDRTCCVCRTKGKPIQIHHIDGNKRNNKIENLAVLCLDCHNDTQAKGGFHRKLNSELVAIYRDNWQQIVERDRLKTVVDLYKEPLDSQKMEVLTSTIETLRERKEYILLAMLYDNIGNKELRDKYIENVLSKPQEPDTVLFLRSLQGKAGSVAPAIIKKEIRNRKKNKDWSQLARLYVDIGKWTEAVRYYCKSVLESIDTDNIFGAAFYLKEMSLGKKLHEKLFQIALKKDTERKDLWWQIRALQELGWNSELDELLKTHEREIKQSGDLYMLALLYKSLNEKDHYVEAMKKMYKGIEVKRVQ
jgi:tetratricopeptide (TPR) repeat protein